MCGGPSWCSPFRRLVGMDMVETVEFEIAKICYCCDFVFVSFRALSSFCCVILVFREEFLAQFSLPIVLLDKFP